MIVALYGLEMWLQGLNNMSEIVRIWLENLYNDALVEAYGAMANEHLWELGYDGDEPNPHTENVENLKEYIVILEERMNELNR